MKRKLLSLLLALVMVLSMVPATAFASPMEETEFDSEAVCTPQDAAAEESVTGHLGEIQTSEVLAAHAAADSNSGMEHLLTDGKLEGTLIRQPLYAATDNGYYTDAADAVAQLRAKMVARHAWLDIPVRVSKKDVPGEAEMEALILGLFALATAHTGVPNEGDYLLWSVESLYYSAEYSEKSGYYYLTIRYEPDYYSTAYAEDDVESRIESILNGFGFTDETDDYTKILSIYSFICDTVAYD